MSDRLRRMSLDSNLTTARLAKPCRIHVWHPTQSSLRYQISFTNRVRDGGQVITRAAVTSISTVILVVENNI
jgi:hypothetical protein